MTDLRRSFHQHLEEIRADVVRLGSLVVDAIPRGTEVLLAYDQADAEAIIERDDELDALTVSIEDRCFHLLATQQPMASDLRAIVTAIRLGSEIERSGDLVVNIVKSAGRMQGETIEPRTRGLIDRLSRESRRLFQISIDAYAEGDAAAAAALDGLDDQLDSLHRDFIHRILEASREGIIAVSAAVQLALIGRYYERIGDHAVNVGERVRYMVIGT